MIPRLTTVEAINKYTLRVCFADGLEGIIDVSPFAGMGVFRAWDMGDLFLRPYVSETGAISWNDDLDLDANNAYLKLKGISFDEWRQRSLQYAAD